MDQSHIRNFCIIAHIDHGKSTLADRMLELTATIPKRQMAEQVLDTMDLERERGITIKAAAVRMSYTLPRRTPGEQGTRNAEHGGTGPVPGSMDLVPRGDGGGGAYERTLIDTPGHVDFTYEVSRALAAAECAVLVVDASQGIEAQTLAHGYMAVGQKGTIIPGAHQTDPPPAGDPAAPLRALIFDSKYDPYKGVIAYVRLVDGEIVPRRRLRLFATARSLEPLEVGCFRPSFSPTEGLTAGEGGYVATGLKAVRDCHVGDTLTTEESPAAAALPGYQPAKPMVFSGVYPAA